MTVYIELG